jgi:Rrf2 family transcriptional regulator, iron-sulfur cluster assembly transcription factor
MKITALEEYGLRCMLLLAKCGPDEYLTLPDFQAREGLSIPYAAKLLMILKKADLVKSVRGRNGGYALAKPAETIILKEIFEALGEPAYSSTHCARHSGMFEICVHTGECKVRDIWKSFDSFMSQILDKITLADIATGKLDILGTVQVSVKNNDNSKDGVTSSST